MLVFITGATAGIGKACAERFAAEGHSLIICGRRKERLEDLKATLGKKYKIEIFILSFDIRNAAEVEEAIASLPADLQKIDVLINNAGLAAGLSSIQDGQLEHWEKMIDTNIKGLLYTTKQIVRLMISRKKGHVVNIGSIAGKEVYPNGNVYCATKHAVDALNKAMRIDLLQHNIKVTGIHPGMVETEFSVVRFDGDAERAKKVYQGLEPLHAEDIAESIYWVATRPAHVNINELTIMPSVQATATQVIRH